LVCLRILRHREDAEDAVQETFYRATRTNTFRGEGFASWIYRIAVNVCRNQLAVQANRREREKVAFEETDPSPTPSQVYTNGVVEAEVSAALYSISTKHREVLILKYIEEFTIPEMSEILSLPATTVEGRLRHGREELRRILQRRRGQ
jgi:RNA polymerase sigma-70 factor, ECF subfamily